MQISIINGIYADTNADFRTAYPRNCVPVPKKQGISNGYLRPGDGIVHFTNLPGIDRGGIVWNGRCYRVAGSKLIEVGSDGSVTELGDVGVGGTVTMDYSFDRLGIASNNNLYYWDGVSLTQVTDPDLGAVIDFIWVDGYFMTTDGESLVITELLDPTSVDPFKYGSSEVDPDPVKCIFKIRDEVVVVNRYTIEIFQNVGGDLFPFQRVSGAQSMRGAVGTHAACVYDEAVAFVGGGRNKQMVEPPAVHISANGQTAKISTREIDQQLLSYTESQLASILVEYRMHEAHQLLYVHLPDNTWCYDVAASKVVEEPVWFSLDSGLGDHKQYSANNFTWFADRWLCGDPTSARLGTLVQNVSSHWGSEVSWEFSTQFMYNDGSPTLVYGLELVALTGNSAVGDDAMVGTAYTADGKVWSTIRYVKAGKVGETLKRLVWFSNGMFRNYRAQKFVGTSKCHLSFARLEAELEAMNG